MATTNALVAYKNRTYGAGYRAGMSPKPLVRWPDGTSTLADADCPFKGRFQVLARFMWWEGHRDGQMVSLRRWLESRRGVQYVL